MIRLNMSVQHWSSVRYWADPTLSTEKSAVRPFHVRENLRASPSAHPNALVTGGPMGSASARPAKTLNRHAASTR